MHTPKQSKTKVCNDVEGEFCSRFLSLFTSLYDVPSADPILTFPPVPATRVEEDTASKKKKLSAQQPFNAIVWDNRVKKATDNYLIAQQQANDKISEAVLEQIDLLDCQKPDLANVFLPEEAARPEVPKYLQNFERDRQNVINEIRNRPKPKPVNVSEAERQFSIRLKKQQQRSKERKMKLQEKHRREQKEHKEFVKSLPRPAEKIEDNYSSMTKTAIATQKKSAKENYQKRVEEGLKTLQMNKERKAKMLQSQKNHENLYDDYDNDKEYDNENEQNLDDDYQDNQNNQNQGHGLVQSAKYYDDDDE
ncbi:hypothetical protein TRFO_12116 [Tritrichomonas foetus]|uniref:Uncharacterized protein n=1 Tax=Tritrichomonas foetus TaxID=1144522 RepID=A0A1J4J6X9_9EUKA|nr:hypothetical protein TRFO_12116 [Tritrichomonas foetus]|eukprot:OHS92940.1 hypothetical protein TRFO_12116 [Tritrichomonas foetus]